jgi:hypothetical protein
LVREILYDCHGRFEGFVLESCGSARRFEGCESSLEQLVLRACRERSKLTVSVEGSEIRQIVVRCC